jgi:hypothetical protein
MSTTNQIVAMTFPLVAVAAAGATVLIVKRFFLHRQTVNVAVQASVSVEAAKVPAEAYFKLRTEVREALSLADRILAEDEDLAKRTKAQNDVVSSSQGGNF